MFPHAHYTMSLMNFEKIIDPTQLNRTEQFLGPTEYAKAVIIAKNQLWMSR